MRRGRSVAAEHVSHGLLKRLDGRFVVGPEQPEKRDPVDPLPVSGLPHVAQRT